jgi:hypothetical protein
MALTRSDQARRSEAKQYQQQLQLHSNKSSGLRPSSPRLSPPLPDDHSSSSTTSIIGAKKPTSIKSNDNNSTLESLTPMEAASSDGYGGSMGEAMEKERKEEQGKQKEEAGAKAMMIALQTENQRLSSALVSDVMVMGRFLSFESLLC